LKNFSGVIPPPPVKKRREDIRQERRGGREGRGSRGGGDREREGKEGGREESGAPSLQASAPPLPLGWLRPCSRVVRSRYFLHRPEVLISHVYAFGKQKNSLIGLRQVYRYVTYVGLCLLQARDLLLQIVNLTTNFQKYGFHTYLLKRCFLFGEKDYNCVTQICIFRVEYVQINPWLFPYRLSYSARQLIFASIGQI
jgi:hypothetical protein